MSEIKLSRKDAEQFFASMENPVPLSDRLVVALKKHDQQVRWDNLLANKHKTNISDLLNKL
jgi:hypothetical protein